MGKYLVVGYESSGEVAIFNIVDGGPPVRHSFPIDDGAASSNWQSQDSADLMCDDYQIFLLGKIPRTTDPSANPPFKRVLNVVDFLGFDN